MSKPPRLRTLASKFFILTAAMVFWVVAVILAYDLRQDAFDVKKGVLLFVVVLLVASAISRMTIRLLARPLNQLQEGIARAREGRLEPIQVSPTGDEIEFLGESFNGMMAALNSTQQELLKTKELLEDRIRQRTQELEIAMQKALAASDAKSEFLANISHELRTPMNGVLGMINMTLESELNTEQRDHLETAQRCAYSLLAILNDLLDLSKIEAGRMALEAIPFDLRGIFDDSIKTHAALASSKGISLTKEIDASVPARVQGDPLRIRQILSNLLSNSVKFTPTGGVTLRVRKLDSTEDKVCLQIEITDTGIGISEDQQLQVFEKFTQADSSIGRRFGGTGLGLAITRSLVELQGGTIAVQSGLGAGSTFTVVLDFLQAPAVAEEQPFGVIAGHVLIVEDNAVNQKLVSALLQRSGYGVTVAENGVEALRKLETNDFDLVLMDVQMPVMDGIETTRAIRADPRWLRLPIVAMTARAMEGDRENCISAGMNGFLTKPIHASHLLSVVEDLRAQASA